MRLEVGESDERNAMETKMTTNVPEREVVAARREGPHDHITKVKLADGSEHDAEDVLASIDGHEAHWFMAHPAGKLLLRVQQCPDCDRRVLWA